MKPSIDVIVLNWNGKFDTFECLEALRRSTYLRTRIVVVDNGSTDDSVAEIRRLHPDIEMVCTDANLGYAGGNNAGLAHCRATGHADYFLVLNNDAIVAPDCLENLIGTAERNPDKGIFSPKIFFNDRRDALWFAGGIWDRDALDFEHLGFGKPDSATYGESVALDYVSGCAFFFRAEILDRIGMFDERYFLLFEEVDFCYRARQAGIECAVSNDAKVFHKVSASIGRAGAPLPTYFYSRNRMLFGFMHLSRLTRMRLLARVTVETLFPRMRFSTDFKVSTLRKIYWLFRKDNLFFLSDYSSSSYRAHLRGLFDYAFGHFGDCPDSVRRQVTKRVVGAAQRSMG